MSLFGNHYLNFPLVRFILEYSVVLYHSYLARHQLPMYRVGSKPISIIICLFFLKRNPPLYNYFAICSSLGILIINSSRVVNPLLAPCAAVDAWNVFASISHRGSAHPYSLSSPPALWFILVFQPIKYSISLTYRRRVVGSNIPLQKKNNENC